MQRTIVIVGGGFSGSVLGLKLAAARSADRVFLIERGKRAGVGLAYGACAPMHLLNVPVSRMELGFKPSFADWLASSGADLTEALAESGGHLADAFVPRALFGRYIEARLAEGLSSDPARGLHLLRGEVVRIETAPARAVVLEDGRRIEADIVILATGNLPPARPGGLDGSVMDSRRFAPDPWADGALDDLPPDAGVLLIGAGLTMVDIALLLAARGHRGPMTAVSRHGLPPSRHQPGGAWAPFLAARSPSRPSAVLRRIRAELARAAMTGVPWQRVFDAARPDVAGVWRSWDRRDRARFLRRLRTLWDTHRHRMAPRIARALDALLETGRLQIRGGGLAALESGEGGVFARLRGAEGGEERVGPFALAVNCTGPRSDFDRLETPLYGHLRRLGLIRPDPLRLGLETEDCAVLNVDGAPSTWLYAVGPLTRPALWEVTAVPEINAQIDLLVSALRDEALAARPGATAMQQAFADLGAGI